MSKSKFVINKIAKIFEQGLVTYNDLSDEIINILKSKKEEIINKLEIPSKEEFEVLKKRVENLEKKQKKINQNGKVILTCNPFNLDLSNLIFPPCD